MIDILIWAALIPSIILIWAVLKQDKIESEPFGLLVKLFAFGALICLPAGILESFGEAAIMRITRSYDLQVLLMYLICVPLAEEGLKYLVLRIGTWKNKAFNFTFDAIVYAVIVSLGFATLENMLYVLNYMSLEVAAIRGIMSVPLHCTCGVFMGYFYGVARNEYAHGNNGRSMLNRVLALVIPIFIHGLYDYALSVESESVTIGGLVFTVVVFILAFTQVRWSSKRDDYIIGTDVPIQQQAPAQPQYQQPVQPQYQQQYPPQYQVPGQPQYQQPVQPQYQQQYPPQYQVPGQPQYQQQYPPQYQVPGQPQYQQPAQPQYQQPVQPIPQQVDTQQKPPSPLG